MHEERQPVQLCKVLLLDDEILAIGTLDYFGCFVLRFDYYLLVLSGEEVVQSPCSVSELLPRLRQFGELEIIITASSQMYLQKYFRAGNEVAPLNWIASRM